MENKNGARSWKESKLLIIFELSAACFFLFGHNIFGFIPIREVPFILICGWIFLRLRGRNWASVGLSRPENWSKTILLGIATATGLQLLSIFVTEPLITYFTHRPTDLSGFRPLVGNTRMLLVYLVLVWTLAAFGEELVYRGYLMNRIADFGNRSPLGWAIGLILVSFLFGIGHFYQGITGMIDTTVSSLVLGGLYFYTKLNLWAPILAHGFTNTIGILIIYWGIWKI
jgi:membrane protease YdiL (CAAX protease family)